MIDAAIRPKPASRSMAEDVAAWIDAFDRILARPLSWSVAVATVILVQTLLVVTHVAWLDEWQALQIAVQSADLRTLLANLHYEGHPPLWYLILRFAAAILPVGATLAGVQLLIALTMQAAILFGSQFKRAERLLIAASYFILFEFGTLSRSLSLGAMLTVVLFTARRRSIAWVIVTLLPMVDFQFGLLSIVAMVLLASDGRWSWVGAGAWAIVAGLAAWSVVPAPDMIAALPLLPVIGGLLRLLGDFSVLLIPFQMMDGRICWGGGLPVLLGFVAGPLFLVFAFREALTTRLHGILFTAFLLATCAVALFVYPIGIRHVTLVALLLILLKGREAAQGRPPGPVFRSWLLVIALGGAAGAAISAVRPFDPSSDAARYIRSSGLADAHWASWPQSHGQAIAGLLRRETLTLRRNCTQSFIRWNFDDGIESRRALHDALADAAGRYGRYYLVTSFRLDRDDALVQPLATFGPGYDGFYYRLYVIAPDRPDTGRWPGPCPPPRLPLDRHG